METDTLAKILWNYLKLDQAVETCDCILVLGSHDVSTVEYAIDLYEEGLAEWFIVSGGVMQPQLDTTEAEGFAQIARDAGVPNDKIVMERVAMNTGENFTATRELLGKMRLDPESFLVVCKPYMERRAHAVAAKLWPDKKVIVTSPKVSYEEYLMEDIPKDVFINTMVGDLQRIKVYGENGFQIPQEIPADVWAAYETLVEMGYSQRLILA